MPLVRPVPWNPKLKVTSYRTSGRGAVIREGASSSGPLVVAVQRLVAEARALDVGPGTLIALIRDEYPS